MQKKNTILIVDDQVESLKAISKALGDRYQVISLDQGKKALEVLEKEEVDVVITDLKMPEIDGMAILKKAQEINPEVAVIMLTAYGTIENAVEAMKEGAADYLLKPVDIYDLRTKVEKVITSKRMHQELKYLRGEVNKKYGFSNIIGNSKAMEEVYNKIIQVAPARTNILLLGESGTGKELVARAIHYNSPRSNQPFIPLDCSALSQSILESELFGHEKGSFTGAIEKKIGRFELAQGGTIFLDEIGEISPLIQVKLLRVLEQREIIRVGGNKSINIDVRLIAATNADLEKAVAQKRLREDLYYRLKVITINLPSLRERKEDIPLLVDYFIKLFNQENQKAIKGVKKEVINLFMNYSWLGNVRELKNAIENMVVMSRGSLLTLDQVPDSIKKSVSLGPQKIELKVGLPLEEAEKEVIKQTLLETKGNKTKAAQLLKIGLRTLQRKLKKYGGF